MEEIKTKKEYSFYIYIIIIIAIVFFLLFSLYKFINKSEIQIYEVIPGEIISENKEIGLIIRDEEVILQNDDGYISYYAFDGSRIKKGSLVYTVSNEKIDNNNNYSMEEKDYNNIKNKLSKYASNINNLHFDLTYDYNTKINQSINELSFIQSNENTSVSSYLNKKNVYYAQNSGILSYHIDGFEKKTKEEIFSIDNIFDIENNSETVVNNNIKTDKGTIIAKIITNPTYEIIFKSDKLFLGELINKNIKIEFPLIRKTTNAKLTFSMINDEKYYVLTLDKYLEDLLDTRVLEFNIITSQTSGLKIPLKSIARKNCYILPKDFVIEDPLTREKYIYLLSKNEKIMLNDIDISKEDEKNYYIDFSSNSKLNMLDILQSSDYRTYTINSVSRMPGVYNVNKGYSVFKYVEILQETNEYAIIKKGLNYSLSSYDHIVLNQNDIKEGDLINK
ncbi:MAG: HlyD family efflux transporter periplasmic adaptor subunit [Eubacteriales bacterium]|nr:HlyD family efflux transporter periplasmic adaptor subunit [Eubacteriales bacterium]